MSFFLTIFYEILYKPLFNGLVFLYNTIPGHDFGLAIIILTIIIRLLMYPLFQKSIRSQQELSALQPKIKEIQKKYKKDKEKQAKAMMELYKEHKVNPLSGCLPLLIQSPILIAFFRVLMTGLEPSKLSYLYSFIANPGAINPMFLGLVDLAKASYPLAILTGIVQFVQAKMMAPKASTPGSESDFATAMSKQMVYMMPILIAFIALKMPAGLPLYWTTLNLFGIIQQYFSFKKKKNAEIISEKRE